MGLTYKELDALPVGAQVRDEDGDRWVKQPSALWSCDNDAELYQEWSSPKLEDRYELRLVSAPEVVTEGVWIVWSSLTKETINAVFPADGEVHALRMVNRDGFGYAQFTPFGETTY